MVSRLNPYLNFDGNARAAMEFYKSVFGGELTASTFAEFGMAQAPSDANLIMHSQLETASGFMLMGSDRPSHMPYEKPAGFSVSLSGDAEAELTGYWNKLSEGANIIQPLTKAPWGDSFGMLKDRFGTDWLVNISAPRGATQAT